ncbi:MAG: ABC transporter permease subunit [Phycisphaerae bacterium]|nr:ABC transporter permease subunit [Phycisphaerae bacterium]
MQTASILDLFQCFCRRRLSGPLFDKELRIASRRRRGYALRFAYVLLLMAFIALVWIPTVQLRTGAAMSRAHMEAAAKTITLGIVWFQFVGVQLVAAIMLSTTVSEEVYGRTLCVLMTTPLSGRQVVMSKFYSRLVQILLLVATTLPLLAIVRVLGGIPWNYLVVSLCVTAAAVVFVGAVSLLFSVLCRRAYLAMIASILSVAFLYAIVPVLTFLLLKGRHSPREAMEMTRYWNPFYLLRQYTTAAMLPYHVVSVSAGQILVCCTVLLSASAGLLACSVRLVKSVALRRAMGEPALLDRLRRRYIETESADKSPKARQRGIRRVVGPPMVWKEMTCTLSRRERFATAMVLGIQVAMILIVYSFTAVMSVVSYEEAHIAYIWIFLTLAVLFTITASTTGISRERESQAWSLLLMTPLTDTDILVGKFVGVLRRCGPIWLLLFAYVVAFAWAKCFHPMAVVHAGVMIVSALLFLSATGFYFGSRCRRTTDAVTANLALAGGLWCVLPIVAEAASFGMGAHRETGVSLIFALVPFGQAFAMVATTLDSYVTAVQCFGGARDAAGMATFMLLAMAGYLLVSLVFAWRAVHAFRRRVF